MLIILFSPPADALWHETPFTDKRYEKRLADYFDKEVPQYWLAF